ncbi:MAG: hypothetical protein KI788_03935 [Mameliella sp.]|nr:hypothetical protein [Mameliella sp.]
MVREQVLAALDAATHENQYPHEYDRDPEDIVREIHDWSGIAGFDFGDPAQIAIGIEAVKEWRQKNPNPEER